ncbi:YdbL family protein [Thermomonas sp.]|uniref:YdbL family protein n=1 Tax=Thermomonas sp. TaxID=1971895 RepID=UPI00391BD792
MKHWMGMPVAAALLLSACVTINVYFPAAEAKEAAKEFVEKIINDADKVEIKESPAGGGGMAMLDRGIGGDLSGFDPWVLVGIGSARAQSTPDITLKTPAIQAIQARMEARFNTILRAGFDSGALGFTRDGLITVRDPSKVELKDRVALNSAVADDNRDRKAVYREVAVANGHPEWEDQIRDVFAKQWIASAKPGWWYESAGGWKQK